MLTVKENLSINLNVPADVDDSLNSKRKSDYEKSVREISKDSRYRAIHYYML